MLQLQVTEEGTRMSPSIPTALFPDLELSDDCNDQSDLFAVESNVWTKGRFKIR